MSNEPTAARAATRSGGDGEIPSIAPQLDRLALGSLRERLGELEPAPRAESLDRFELPPAQPLPQALIRRLARTAFSPAARIASATPRGVATPTSPGCAAVASRQLPTPSSCPLTPPRVRTGARRSAPREGVAVVPFGGGTSVVGGVEPLRGGHGR